jgi:histidine ammonia-lyase
VELARAVVAIEIMSACQGIDLLAPLKTATPLQRVHAVVRAQVPTLGPDRPPAPDMDAIAQLIDSAALEQACGLQLL